jgi:integrase
LGKYPVITLARARTMALEAQAKVAEGLDPRQEASGAMTVSTLAEAFIERHARKLKTGKAFATRLRNNVVPVIGNVRLAELHRRDVHRVLDVIADRGSLLAASKAQQDIRTMVRWAIQRGYLDADPMVGMGAALKSKPRERFLSEDEIAKLWPALALLRKPVELALRLALVTGQRIGEICAMHEDELDVAKAVWTIPEHKTKNGRRHTVPLTAMALDIIAEARRGAEQRPAVSDIRLSETRTRLARCSAPTAGQRLGGSRFAPHALHSPRDDGRVAGHNRRRGEPRHLDQGGHDAANVYPIRFCPREAQGARTVGR